MEADRKCGSHSPLAAPVSVSTHTVTDVCPHEGGRERLAAVSSSKATPFLNSSNVPAAPPAGESEG